MDDPIDRLRFWIDTFPRSGPMRRLACLSYQPLPWLGLYDTERAEGTMSRWEAMCPWLDRTAPGSALDVGSNQGFFTLSLASRGIPTIGVEIDPPAYRTTLHAIRRTGITDVGVLVMRLSPSTVGMLPGADCVLFLSVWHHFVHELGLERATTMLSTIWRRTAKVLFFDTGEEEMPPSFGLPAMTPTPQAWLTEYLSTACPGGHVVHLGQHQAYAPDGGSCRRNLFAIARPEPLDGGATR